MEHFGYRVWITVSQPYNIEELLRKLLKELCEQQKVNPPQNIQEMNKESLLKRVRYYLQKKRYVVVFDDVWEKSFWADIKFAMSDNQKGCRISITTRFKDVATSCRESSFVEIHELKGLDDEQSLKLFNKKAFYDLNGCCPENLVDISSKIVEKCDGLPLAIVVTGGLLSAKNRNAIEWDMFNENFKPKLKEHSVINKILVPSYHDLSYNLKSCLLYFGIYPEDYEVYSKSLIRQWIAEGFVKEEEGLTLEEVAEGYLTELIHRSLVQVVSVGINGAIWCRVHDLVHDMILKKFEDLNFCKNISEDGQSASDGIVRRLSITTNSDNFMESIESSLVRTLLVPKPCTLHESVVRQITTKCRLLKVFDGELAGGINVPEDLGSLNHLKYFSIEADKYGTAFTALPKSIGMLENLETFGVTQRNFTDERVIDVPKEICKLRKLRHFLGHKLNLVELKDAIGGMTSLQTLPTMQQMENLSIESSDEDIIDLDLNLPKLQYLLLEGQLEKLAEWIPNHQNLVQLELTSSKLTEDPMKLLKSMPNLLSIYLIYDAYVGALPSLEKLFISLRQLERLPTGIQHLKKLELLDFRFMSEEFMENILQNGGRDHWIFKQVSSVQIYDENGKCI
ncbi:hypothetical protein TSUD_153270 [Trifolium subterraneum]|uniref:Uncharacterized protein n=1 Tax=Trifolium subterraneum TaxID=3900 RepID=A0A2Z6NIM7_TRISU|nr:hypothetical protein TSUD_153270 [Trifolium subterraneum]